VFAALLDTNVIWPSLRRDFLLSMAIEGLYRPLWSEQILAELHHHEAKKLAGRGQCSEHAHADADHLIREMRRAFSDAIVAGWDPLVGTHGLPDPDDEHVLAAAVIGGAGAIVTERRCPDGGGRHPDKRLGRSWNPGIAVSDARGGGDLM
jgi:PIN domain